MASKPYELFSAAFSRDTHRTPRSREYKEGVLALLRRQLEGTPLKCPWDIGTASFDAFFAGVDEGWGILRKHGITSRELPNHIEIACGGDLKEADRFSELRIAAMNKRA